MLRESSKEEGNPARLRGLIDTSVDIEVRECETLCSLSTALVARDRSATSAARDSLVTAIGAAAALRSIGVVANFQMMNRALDAVGIPAHLDPTLATDLGVDAQSFGGAHGTG